MTKDINQEPTVGEAFRQAAGGTAPMPQLFGRQPLNSANQMPALFTPPPINNTIPEANYNSQAGSFALKSLNPKVAETANRPALDGLTSQDGMEKQTQLNMAIKGSLERDDGIPVENKLNAAKTALQIGVQPGTTGQLYKEKVYGAVPESRINESLDKKIVQDDAKANILTNMGYDPLKKTFDDVMNQESNDFFNIIKDSWTFALPTLAPVISTPGAKEAVGVLLEEGANEVIQFIGEKTTGNQNASLKDVVKYLSYLPQDPEAEIEHRKLIQTVFGKTLMEDKIQAMKNWDTEYRAKFGDGGYYKLASFMAKEATVDAVAIAIALKSPGLSRALLPETVAGQVTSGIMARMVKALGRASVMGLAGTGVQESMDSYLGFPTNTTNELGTRIAGAFVGEGIARVLAVAGRGIIGAGYRAIEGGTKLVSKTGEPVATVGENVLEEAVQGITPTIKDLIPKDPSTYIPSIGDEVGNTLGIPTVTTVPVRDIGSQLTAAMQANKSGTLGHIFDMTDSEITAATLAQTPTMKENILLHGVGNRLIGEKVARQTDVDKVLDYYFNPGLKTVSMRNERYTGDTSPLGIKGLFVDPRRTIGSTADDAFDVKAAEAVQRNAMLQAQKVAFKGINEPVTNHILSIREKHGNLAAKDPNFVVTQTTLDAEGLTPAQQDAYWAVGKLTDFSAMLEELSAMQNAVKKNIKLLHGQRHVQVLKHLEGEDYGAVMVRDIKGGEPFFEHSSSLSDTTQAMGYRKYATPRRYKDANYLAATIDFTTGKIDVHTTSQYKSEIEDFVAKQDVAQKGTGKATFYFQPATGEASMNFGVGSNSAAALDVLDDAGIQALRDALAKGGRPDMTDEQLEGIQLGFDNITFGSITSQKVAGSRGAGLKTVTGKAAAYKPHSEALTQHLMEVAALQSKDFRLDAIAKFRKEFKGVLRDPMGGWDQPVIDVLGKKELAQKARSVQDFIRRSIFNETSYGKSFRSGVDGWVEGMRSKGGMSKSMIDGIEKQPLLMSLFKQTRDGTTFLRKMDSFIVFAGNAGSFITQVAAPTAIIAGMKLFTNPTHIPRGLTTMMSMLMARAMSHGAISGADNKALQALRRSGFITDTDLEEMAYRAAGQTSTLYNKGMAFVGKGEQANGLLAWSMTREEMIDKAKAGTLKGITKMLGKDDIDSPEFLQIVNTKAKQIRLDMSPSGKIGLTSGAGATIFQYMSPWIKTHTLLFASDLSAAEKFGAAVGLFSFYGLAAVPFLGTGIYVMDKTGAAVSGSDEIDDATMATDITNNVAKHLVDEVGDLAGFTKEQKDFFTNTVKKGLVSTLTGNDVSLYQKMSLALFSKNVVANSTSDVLDSIPFISIMRNAGESASNITEMLQNLHHAYMLTPEQAAQTGETLSSPMQKAIDMRQTLGDVMDEVGNAVPGIGKIADVLNNNPETRRYLNPNLANQPNTGFVTRSGKRIETGEQVDTRQQMLMLFGIVPAPVQANREIMKGQFDRVQILKDMQDTWVQRYKNVTTSIAKDRVLKAAALAATEAEQVLMATYQGALSIATGSSDDRVYKAGTLRTQWFNAFQKIDQEAMSGNKTTSKGEPSGQ